MTDISITSAPAPATTGRTYRISPKLKAALDLMVWDGVKDNEAAVRTKINVQTIRIALKQPHVRAYFRGQLDVLRERENPANIHALIGIRDNGSNQMATVAAVNALMKQDNQAIAGAQQASPGVVIVIQQASPIDARLTRGPVIDAEMPMITKE